MGGSILLLAAAACQGSFGIGMKTYQPYRWENFRIPFAVMGMFLYPVMILSICLPDYYKFLFADKNTFLVAVVCGLIWGISAIYFDMAILEVGIALTYGINFGISATFGSLLALPFTGEVISGKAFGMLLLSTLVITAGIVVITKAGFVEQNANASVGGVREESRKPLSKKGILYGIFAGLGSVAMNVGFTYATPIGEAAVKSTSEITAVICERLVCWMPIFIGGLIPSLIYCVRLLIKNSSFVIYKQRGSVFCLIKAFGTAILWFGALFIYGCAVVVLGDSGSVTGWVAFTAMSLLISNVWSLYFKEWTDGKAKRILLVGNVILVAAFVLVGIANYC